MPAAAEDARQRGKYFDTRAWGKNATGHEFPDVLDRAEKRVLLEYLKTL